MNEQIKRLYAGAVISVHDSFTERMLNPSQVDLKFAQLIVEDTLKQVNNAMELTWPEMETKIKQHFGVKA